MDENTIESSFCFKYLSKFVGLKRSTIESLVANDYDTIYSLMALNIDIDLNQLPNVSMGQKSVLREALMKLRNEFNVWIKSKPNTDSPFCHSVLNSTPNSISKVNEYPFVQNDQLFKEFITTAMMDVTGGQHSGTSFEPKVSSYADSGINGTDSEVLKLSAIKRRRTSAQNKTQKNNKSLKTSENDKNSKQNKSIDKIDNQNKPKRKRKKFLYSLNGTRNQSRNNPKDNPLSGRKSNSDRRVFIDIDKHSKIEDTNRSNVRRGGKRESNQTTDESAVKSNNLETTQLKPNEKIEKKTKTNPENHLMWKTKKSEIIELLKNKSNRIKLKKDEKLAKDLHQFFKVVEIDGTVTPFIVCGICYDCDEVRLLMTSNSTSLKSHLCSKRHQNGSLWNPFGKEDSKLKVLNDSDLSVEEFNNHLDNNSKSDKQIAQKSRTPKKKSLEELSKRVSDPQICVTKIDISFDESKNRYLAKLLDTESQSCSQIVINNYDQVFRGTNRIVAKAFVCDFKGCCFSSDYPFSLEQHKIGHEKKTLPKSIANTATKMAKKSRSLSVLNAMNSYVLKYMKNNTKDLNMSAPLVCQSPNSKYSSDCLLLKPNIECISNNTNDQNIDNKIVTKIKDWLKPKTSFNQLVV